MKNLKQINSRSLFFFILRNFAEVIGLTIAGFALIFYASYYIETMILNMRFGEDVLEQEEWPTEAYEILSRSETVMLMTALLLFVIVVLFYTFRIRNRILKPLQDLSHAITAYAAGEEVPALKPSGVTELDTIMGNYEHMIRQVKESEEHRRQMEADRRHIMAGISHDLRTPVTVIRGYAGAICDGLVTGETEQQYLRKICRKADVLAELIGSLYDYSRLDHPAFVPELQEGDLCEFFREYLASKYEELTLAGCSLEADLPEETIRCSFDRYLIERALDNIVNNSVKHNGPGTTVYAGLRRAENGKTAILTLGDDGKGIPPQLTDRLFEPLVTGNESRSENNGSGLGLSITRMILEAHGGTIRLEAPAGAAGVRKEGKKPAGPAAGREEDLPLAFDREICGARFQIRLPL